MLRSDLIYSRNDQFATGVQWYFRDFKTKFEFYYFIVTYLIFIIINVFFLIVVNLDLLCYEDQII